MTRTSSREVISTRQEKLAALARIEPKLELTTLAHHIDAVWSAEAYRRTRKDGAVGVDGVTARAYEAHLEANLASLLERFKTGRYRAPAVRRVHIPMEDGVLSHPKQGTPQGGVISPLLSNLYLHEVLDVWFEREVKSSLSGRAFEVRYADDAVLAFEREEDARRVMAVLPKRFGKYGLRLHPEKTRLVDFRRPPSSGGLQRGRSFELLGFTHFWGRSRKGRWVVRRKTASARFSRALVRVGQWCRTHRHWSLAEQHAALSRKLQGHYAYYGLTGNADALLRFRYAVDRLWRKWLSRRSRKARLTWEAFDRVRQRYPLPPARVVHSVFRRSATS